MAIEQELHALEKNDTWPLTSWPPNKGALTSKKVRMLSTRLMVPSKGTKLIRLVIRGFKQVKSKDYKHIVSLVAATTTC